MNTNSRREVLMPPETDENKLDDDIQRMMDQMVHSADPFDIRLLKLMEEDWSKARDSLISVNDIGDVWRIVYAMIVKNDQY